MSKLHKNSKFSRTIVSQGLPCLVRNLRQRVPGLVRSCCVPFNKEKPRPLRSAGVNVLKTVVSHCSPVFPETYVTHITECRCECFKNYSEPPHACISRKLRHAFLRLRCVRFVGSKEPSVCLPSQSEGYPHSALSSFSPQCPLPTTCHRLRPQSAKTEKLSLSN